MTQKIIKNQLNLLTLTLSELKNPEVGNNWLFVFTLDQTSIVQARLQLLDVSPSPDSYNQFELTDGEGEQVNLYAGDYRIDCYQMPDSNSTDETQGVRVEVTKARVFDSSPITAQSYSPPIDTEVYEQGS